MADVVQSNSAAHHCHGDGPTSTAGTGSRHKRPSTREKIAKMVADGAVNYPAYLKLIYTGDSEQEPSSSEDEFSVSTRVPAPTTDRPETRDIRLQRATGDGDRLRRSTEQALSQQSQQQQQHPRSSPESDKLMDDGREKQSTSAVGSPIDCHDDGRMTPSSADDFSNRLASTDDVLIGSYQSAENEMKLREDLMKIQNDIATLRSVLNTKLARAAVLRKSLGMTAIAEIKHDLQNSLRTIKQSETFQKTNAAFKSFGAYASRTMGNLRQSIAFKSVEMRVGSIRTSQSMGNLKSRLSSLRSSKSENNVATASANDLETVESDDDDEDDYFNKRFTASHGNLMTSATNPFTG